MNGPSSLRRRDCWNLLGLLACALLLRGWLVTHTEVLARDSVEFIRLALRFESQPWREVLRATHQAPGYPLLILMALQVTDALGIERTSEHLATCAQLVSGIAGLLTIIPMYLTGRRIAGPTCGFLAALIFQLLPVCVRVTTDGLSEGVFFFFVATGLHFGIAAMQERSYSRFLLCGIAAGLAYLTRPEGGEILIAIGISTVVAGACAREWLQMPLRLAALALGALPFVGGYVMVTGHLTRKPASVRMFQAEAKAATRATAGPPFAVFWNEAVDAGHSRGAWAARSVLFEANRSAHYVGLVLALGGIVLMRDRLRHDGSLWPPILLAGLHALLLWRMAYVSGYVSERHAMMIAFVAIFGAGAFFAHVANRLPRRPAPLLAATASILAFGLPSTLKPMHANRAGHHAAGGWLATRATGDDEIIDPFAWARFYAGSVIDVPSTPQAGTSPRKRFIVVEASGNEHGRLQSIDTARALAARGERVYHWPEDVAASEAVVLVYRVDAGR